MPLCPFEDAKSAGVLPCGYLGLGSVNAPGAAPREMRAATVRSLIHTHTHTKETENVDIR